MNFIKLADNADDYLSCRLTVDDPVDRAPSIIISGKHKETGVEQDILLVVDPKDGSTLLRKSVDMGVLTYDQYEQTIALWNKACTRHKERMLETTHFRA